MKTKKSLYATVAVVTCCVIVAWFSTSIHGKQNTYELRPQLSIPEHKTDIARVIDAYERLMDRYLDLTERNSEMIGADIQNIAVRLDLIDGRLAELLTRTARMETALGIKEPPERTGALGSPKAITPDLEARTENPG